MEDRLRRWEHATEWPLTTAAIAFLIAYSWEVIADLIGPPRTAAETIINVTWALFAVDVAVQLILTTNRWTWVKKHPVELASVILPMLRPLRLLRLVTLISVFQRTAGHGLRGRIAIYTAGSAALLTWVGALAALDAERHAPDATITSLGDALWWAFATITTVGYGDTSPTTTTGRAVAVALMIGGITVLGVVTGTLASWLVSSVSDEEAEEQAATREQVAQLSAQVETLTGLLQDQAGTNTQGAQAHGGHARPGGTQGPREVIPPVD
jgi:voltage-gated potassium channel